ncbi:T-complex protein 11 X-linked protein 2 isoform X2 [Cynoglossus semilaevis]|uniref:T-complex protein 11 X-linked protein 2 isoform X2 n=1 Tax=Cynoglossus semilaevis TaxID=244447 RepID=UPI000495885C|nr:T-complex protein 11 X-linked protein 2 isoform X2 [Cynoglossus semilaevis]
MSNQKDQASDGFPTDLPCLEKLDSPTGSPPIASSSSLMELGNCVSNLSLAHEILVNKDFSLTPKKPPTDSLQEQLSSDPPNYTRAVVLLMEVKTMLQSLLLPGHIRLRSQLDEVLDMDLINQEVDHGALDLHRLAGYIINTMASLCAPVRDPEVRALRELREPVELLRNIFLVLKLMKTDMANFTIQSLRPHLLQQAVFYERTKFQQILDKQPNFLDNTTTWLEAAASEERSIIRAQADSPIPGGQDLTSATSVLNRAYLRLLSWDPQSQKYPETVLMDRARLDDLGQQLQMLVLEASVLLLAKVHCGDTLFSSQGFVGKLRQTITALLEGSHTREADQRGALVGLENTVLQQVKEAAVQQAGAALPQGLYLLRGQISDLWKHDNAIRTLIGERVQGFLQAMLQGSSAKGSPDLAAPLRLVSAELTELGTNFRQIVNFNRTVFGPFYAPILRKLMFPSGVGEAWR